MLLSLVRRYIRPYRRLVVTVMALQLVSSLALLYLPTINASIIDDGVARGNTAVIVRLGVAMLGVTGLQMLCGIGALYCGALAGSGFGRDLRLAMFTSVTGFSEEETIRFGPPSLLIRTTNDVRQIQLLVQMSMTALITAPSMSIGGVIMAIHQDARLSWLLVVSVPVLALVNYTIVRRMLPVFRRMQKLIDGINRVLRDQLSGIRVIRAFAREPVERERFEAANTALSDTALTVGNLQAVLMPASTFVINASSVALIWFGALRIDSGQVQVGSLVAFLSYFMQILMSVMMATMVLTVLPRAAVCAERINEVIGTEPTVTAPAEPLTPTGGARGLIEVDRVSFRYPGADRSVLQDVTFSARPGGVTAVIGSTGSGKSTLVSLMCRLRDVTHGAIRVDGVDVRDRDPEQLWAGIGLIPQRAQLFTGTVADNLRYGIAPGQQVTDEEMWHALRVAAADDFVAARPHGLSMWVAQGGANFSGGQRQRLAIARAVIRRPEIYIFDDAFSALDTTTDARVRGALRELATDATVIIIAQRVSTISEADQVVVLDDGRVVGVGTHDELIADCPTYADLVDSQSLTVDVGGST